MELRDFFNVLRTRKWVIIWAVVIVTLAALAVALVQPKTYEGAARVLIMERDSASAILGNSSPASTQPERVIQTQVQMMTLRPIVVATIKKLNLRTSAEELRKHIVVRPVGQSDVVEISAQDGDPRIAASIANTLADEYVKSARASNKASIAAAANEVQQRLDAMRAGTLDPSQSTTASESASGLPAQPQVAAGTYANLVDKLEQLRIKEKLESGPGRVVGLAVVADRPIAPQPGRYVALGLALGLVLGLGLAFLMEYMDNTIKSSEEAERLFGAPVLGTIPLETLGTGEMRRLSIVSSPRSSGAEAYRVLRNSIDFINFQNDIKKIVVTSAAPAEGKSTVAANLAATLAQAGRKVVLVSVDFRRPTTDQFFKVNNLVGLSDVLVGAHSLKSALQRPGDEQLLVLTAGKMPPNPSELLGSSKMHEVIDSLGEWAEWVIIDAPPLLAVADPASVARWTDGVLIVSQAGVSTRDAAKKAAELLEKVGAHTIGVVVWGVGEPGSRNDRNRDYAGGYYYSSYYGQPTDTGKSKKPVPGSEQIHAGDQQRDGEPEPKASAGRKTMTVLGRVLTGLLAFVAVIAVIAIATYFLDQYFGWGVLAGLTDMWPR